MGRSCRNLNREEEEEEEEEKEIIESKEGQTVNGFQFSEGTRGETKESKREQRRHRVTCGRTADSRNDRRADALKRMSSTGRISSSTSESSAPDFSLETL